MHVVRCTCSTSPANMSINMVRRCVWILQVFVRHTRVPWITFVHRNSIVDCVRVRIAQLIVFFVVRPLISSIRHDHDPKICLSSKSGVSQQNKRSLTNRIASTTHRPDMTPTLTQGNMLQSVCPSPDEPDSSGKKLLRQLFSAVVCRVADMIIHTAATANAATSTGMWNAT